MTPQFHNSPMHRIATLLSRISQKCATATVSAIWLWLCIDQSETRLAKFQKALAAS